MNPIRNKTNVRWYIDLNPVFFKALSELQTPPEARIWQKLFQLSLQIRHWNLFYEPNNT
jgi:hypothetical protein